MPPSDIRNRSPRSRLGKQTSPVWVFQQFPEAGATLDQQIEEYLAAWLQPVCFEQQNGVASREPAPLATSYAVLREGPHADAARALAMGFCSSSHAVPAISRWTQGVVDEFAEEPGGADGPAPWPSDVGQVGEGACAPL